MNLILAILLMVVCLLAGFFLGTWFS
ncbi:YneF family protein, partial [Lactococcus lactis]|nr:YneF family protein [Lactococcus lactis]